MGSQPRPAALNAAQATAQCGLKETAGSICGLASPSPDPDPLHFFDQVFKEAPALSDLDLEQAFRLRYEVYCMDRGFEEAAACPDEMERDHYDDYAFHSLLSYRDSRQMLGTVRLVQPAATPNWITRLPLAEYTDIDSIAPLMRLPAGRTAEVSRFAITRSARKHLDLLPDTPAPTTKMHPDWRRKLLPYMSLGLIRGLIRNSMEHGITHWCLAAEPGLLRRLRAFGLHFTCAGPLIEHRGLRQICYAELASLLQRAEAEKPECWDVMTVGGFLLSDDVAMSAA